MQLLDATIDILILLLALAATVIIVIIVFRTQKGLDRAFKFYLVTAITLSIAGFLNLDQHFNLIPSVYNQIIFLFSRLIALIFFVLGSITFLLTITKITRR